MGRGRKWQIQLYVSYLWLAIHTKRKWRFFALFTQMGTDPNWKAASLSLGVTGKLNKSPMTQRCFRLVWPLRSIHTCKLSVCHKKLWLHICKSASVTSYFESDFFHLNNEIISTPCYSRLHPVSLGQAWSRLICEGQAQVSCLQTCAKKSVKTQLQKKLPTQKRNFKILTVSGRQDPILSFFFFFFFFFFGEILFWPNFWEMSYFWPFCL